MREPILRLDGLSKYYTTGSSVVMGLNNVTLSFCAGEFVAITGESGSGKSTLAHVIGGILPYESGEMLLRGKPTSHYDGTDYERYRRDQISFISQSYGILPGCSVLENVISALRLSGMEKAQARTRAEEILHQVELWELRKRRAAKLSSGQKQRLSIARALAKPAPILLADEPTGNLDPENSAKVISLLAQAAKERLVILITHEFSEAEGHATRHIALQDGRVVMDAQLRPTAEAQLPTPPARKKQWLTPYVSRLQLSGRPVWCGLLALFFTLTAFAVFAFLGTFIIALDDTDTRLYDNSAFRNGSRTRIVAIREDGQPMTDRDYETILSLSHVEALERYGYLADVNYAYEEGRDYTYTYAVQSSNDLHKPNTGLETLVSLTEQAPFAQTVPLLPNNQKFLTAGRLPENLYEVVAAGSPDLIGSAMPVFLQDNNNWGITCRISLEVTVVGVTDYGAGLYFHEDLGRAFTDSHTVREAAALFLYSPDLNDHQIRVSQTTYAQLSRKEITQLDILDRSIPGALEDPTNAANRIALQLIPHDGNTGLSPTHNSNLNSYYQVSRNTFDRVLHQEVSNQVSITISDYAYTDRVLDALKAHSFIAISPFREGSTQIDPTLAKERKQTLTFCAAALLAVLILQVTVLRALFSSQSETFRLLSNIGLTRPVASRSVFLQILLFTLLGQIAAGGALAVCGLLEVPRIAHILRYLPPAKLLTVSAIHLAASLLAALWVSRAMTHALVPVARKHRDLDMEEGGTPE